MIMNKKVEIKYETIEIPKEINVDGTIYPRHKWNLDVVSEYKKTGDEKVLDKLKDFSLDI